MSRVRRNHPAKFKAQVALSALREDAPISELALKYGVHSQLINRWKKEALFSMETGFSGKQETNQKDHASEIKALHAKIGQQSVELDFLQGVSNRLGLGGAKK